MTTVSMPSGAAVAAPPPLPPARRRSLLPGSTLARHALLSVLALAALMAVTSGLDAYRDYQVAQASVLAVAVAGLTVLTGANGQISLGHGALMAIGGYTTALLLEKQGWPLTVCLVVSVVVTAAAGALAGAAAARLRGPYLAGATLALAIGLPGLAIRFPGLLGGDEGLPVITEPPPTWLGATFPFERWYAWTGCAVAVAAFFLLANLLRSRVGRTFRAVRDDEVAASLAGINVARTQVLAFVVSAACAGLAGGMFGVVVGLVSPTGFTLVLSLSLLTGVVLGGLGKLSGAVYGGVALVLLPSLSTDTTERFELPSQVGDNLPLVIYGVLLVVVMLTAPMGIAGGLTALRARLRRPRTP